MTDHYAIAVIGHVDHGKTSLVRSLTGLETDRLAEEKARGLSIELGFAHQTYAEGTVDFIDAPGHEDFIRTMISGTSGVPIVLLVVSAVDGFEHQTEEHLEIAARLGICKAIIALTKWDLVPPDDRHEARKRISARLVGTPFEAAPIICCSSTTGEGLDDLHGALSNELLNLEPPRELGGFFLPVDRVFSAIGSGTIVTGTLKGGAIAVGDAAAVTPSKRSVVVRKIQVRGKDVSTAGAGTRVALNLRGAAVADIKRGDVICTPDVFVVSQRVNVSLDLSEGAERPLRAREEIRVHLGTASHVAKAYPLEDREFDRGASRFVQLRFAEPVIAHPGQMLVVRRLSPPETLGGACVLDEAAPKIGRGDVKTLRLMTALKSGDIEAIAKGLFERDLDGLRPQQLVRLAGIDQAQLEADLVDIGDGLLAPASTVREAEIAVLKVVDNKHAAKPTDAGISIGELRGALSDRYSKPLVDAAVLALKSTEELEASGGILARRGFDPLASLNAAQKHALAVIEESLRQGGLSPPDLVKELSNSNEKAPLLSLLIVSGQALKLRNQAMNRDVVFDSVSIEQGASKLRDAFPFPEPFKTGEARALLGTSRKFIVPLLEHYDATGVTIRTGDTRFCAPPAT